MSRGERRAAKRAAMIDIEHGLGLIREAVADLDNDCGINVYAEANTVEEAVATLRFTATQAKEKSDDTG